MRDTVSGVFCVYIFDDELGESRHWFLGYDNRFHFRIGHEPKFASALVRLNQDMVKCMGIMQLLPEFLNEVCNLRDLEGGQMSR